MPLYDYLYVDLPKVISLYSQLTGGVVEARETTREQGRTADNKRAYDFRVFRHDAGGTSDDRSGTKELIKPHHAVLAELEHELNSQGYLLNLDGDQPGCSLRNPELRQLLASTLCVKVTGRAVIEDYERMKGISSDFPEISNFVNKSIESSLKQSQTYKDIATQLDELSADVRQEKDKNLRAQKESRVRQLKTQLEAVAASAGKVGQVEQWVLDGFRTWVDAFIPGVINLRIYPSIDRPDEQLFGLLKREHFEDATSNSFHFTYGTIPTEKMSMIGVVTALPTEQPDAFDPLTEFSRSGLHDHESVESGFRGLFRGFGGLEQMIRTTRYPRVLVRPVVVYRSVQPQMRVAPTQ
jgi:hypothetical protein